MALELASKAALGNDQVGELGGDVDVGLFERRALDGGQPVGSGDADRGRAAGEGGGIVAVALKCQALQIGYVGERQLADGLRLAVGVGSGHGAVGADGEALIGAAGVSRSAWWPRWWRWRRPG